MTSDILFVAAICIMYTLVFAEAALTVFFYKGVRHPKWPAWFLNLARNRRAVIYVIPAIILLVRLALLPWLPIREPLVTDEHSYLLMADTFSSGRLANPVHPMGRHFESIHVMQKPSYASMYQPAQGLVLAFGQVVFGHPWYGVWVSTGLMMAAVMWMLYAWLPPRWALLIGVIACLRLGIFSYWMNSYWGGAPAAIGGALLLGALARLLQQPRTSMAVLMGAGAGLMALSRPFEGMMLCIGAGIVLVWKLPFRQACRVLIPIGATALIGVAMLGFYFQQVTGSPLKPAEIAQREPYAVANLFYWQDARPELRYPDKAMHDFYAVWEKDEFLRPLHRDFALKGAGIFLFFVGAGLTLPFLAGLRPQLKPLYVVFFFGFASLLLTPYFYAHYTAPALSAILVVIATGLRRIYVWKRETRHGARWAQATALGCLVVLPLRLMPNPTPIVRPFDWPMAWFWTSEGNVERARVLRELSDKPGEHVVIVRYNKDHKAVDNEWVYNRADIDRAKVILARDLGEQANDELVRYYSKRHFWVVHADEKPARLEHYPVQNPPDTALVSKKL